MNKVVDFSIQKVVAGPAQKLMYLLSHGFSLRMVLHSELISEINQNQLLAAVLVPEDAKDSIAGMTGFETATAEFKKSRLQMTLADVRRYLKEPIRENAALWSRHLYLANGVAGSFAKYRAHANYAMHKVFFQSPALHGMLNSIDRSSHRSAVIRKVLIEHKPDLLISTYPVTSFEVTALFEAQSLGIPTVGHLLSWDNITCKGRFPAVPDYFVSWGPVMTAELQEHYDVPRERVFELSLIHI